MSRNFSEWSDIDMNFTMRKSGEIHIVRGEDAINQSIKIILATVFGEHVRSDVGSGLFSLLFEPMSTDIAEIMEDTIEENIEQHENRVTLNSVRVVPFYNDHYYYVVIDYLTRPTKSKKTLEYYAPALGVM